MAGRETSKASMWPESASARGQTGATASDRLLAYLLERRPDEAFTGELSAWLAGSPRFRAFAEHNRDKIRKKLRGARDADAVRDLRAELRAACLFVADRRLDVTFEGYGSGRAGPDFTLRLPGERDTNVEVTRMRPAPSEAAYVRVLLGKLRQFPPGAPNVLLVAIDEAADAAVVERAARELRSQADRGDDEFFGTRGFTGRRDFYERFLRLGAVVAWSEAAAVCAHPAAARAALWINRSARIGVPTRVLRACVAALQTQGSSDHGAG